MTTDSLRNQSYEELSKFLAKYEPKTWEPTKYGAQLWGRWGAVVRSGKVGLAFITGKREPDTKLIDVGQDLYIQAKPGFYWAKVILTGPSIASPIKLVGLKNSDAEEFVNVVERACVKATVDTLRKRLASLESPRNSILRSMSTGSWITSSSIETIAKNPFLVGCFGEWKSITENTYVNRSKKYLSVHELELLELASEPKTEIRKLARERNQIFLTSELNKHKGYFDSVEKNPLTDEQRRAVVTFDDNVMCVASAGSGKTSLLVAKAGYAIRTKQYLPEQILMLAFNKDAADELADRVRERLGPNIDGADRIEVGTFHSVGLSIIGKATGAKPRVAPWIDQGREVSELLDIIACLMGDKAFAAKWGLFKTVLSTALLPVGSDEEPEWWDSESGRRGFRTLRGETVKSQEERMIADWLAYQGINYEYERSYSHETATEEHSQYHPDFYYPSADLYHEHFALDQNGNPPDDFEGYADGVEWKRNLHNECGTKLVETTSFGIRQGNGFELLEKKLVSNGVRFGEIKLTDTQLEGLIDDVSLLRVFRTFMSHVKSNRLSMDDLHKRAKSRPSENPYRDQLFLSIFKAIWREWDDRLSAGNYVDFDDMLCKAVDYLVEGKHDTEHRLILADEFQDSSRIRGALLEQLSKARDARLFVVGDDWQAVNRFAGADISLMRDFERFFGASTTVKLTKTFRCPHQICDVAGEFISRNPHQLKKQVHTSNDRKLPSIICFRLDGMDSQTRVLSDHLDKLADKQRASNRATPVSAYILGRYNSDKPTIFFNIKERISDVVSLHWSTVHRAKGLEADYIFLMNVIEARKGVPSKIEDDSTLWIAMPDGEDFPHAEERRLFYVALTRAKKLVSIYTDVHRPSEFVTEISSLIEMRTEGGDTAEIHKCPTCSKGVLVSRVGKYGEFLSCSRFPRCDHSENIGSNARTCPKCSTGKVVLRSGKYGKFKSCNRYPKCDYSENLRNKKRRPTYRRNRM